MEKEEKKQNSQGEDREDALSESDFGFVHDFFISEDKGGGIEKTVAREQPQEIRESELKAGDQSVTFFLPDFFTDDT